MEARVENIIVNTDDLEFQRHPSANRYLENMALQICADIKAMKMGIPYTEIAKNYFQLGLQTLQLIEKRITGLIEEARLKEASDG